MRCAACDEELLAGKRFCHGCGAPAPQRCPHCGAALEARYRFCPECGQPVGADEGEAPAVVPAVGAEGERRQVTVLFCDLVGSTAIAERLDPEEFHELLEKYLAAAFPAIYRVEGVVNQLAGDGLLAIFGAPVAHEDDPQRAVRAALAVRDAVAGLADRLEADGGPRLTVRIGIHTGPVVVGSFGTDWKADYTAIGDTTNLASRLQALAEPGTILMSDATHRLVRGFFEVRDAGAHAVRGKQGVVQVWEVRGRRSAATAMSVAEARGLTPLAGRTAELDRLLACYARLERGEAQVVTVVGSSGVGKSRLVYEFRRRLSDEPPVFFEAYTSSMNRDVPYHPIMTMMRRHFGLESGDTPERARTKIEEALAVDVALLERTYPRLMRLLSVPIEERRDVPADELKRETFDAVARLVVGVSQRRPVVVLLEDLHWIDAPSRELVTDLIGRLQRSRIMILATHRPEVRITWRTRATRTRLELGPLAADDIRRMTRSIVGCAVPRELEDLVVARAAGSPFFAEELVRALLEQGHVVPEDGRCRLTGAAAALPVPGTVQEVIAARLDRLPPAARRALQVAAVLGREFRVPDLRALLAPEHLDVDQAVGELEMRGLVHRKLARDADELRFGESLTQEVAYEGLLLRQRRDFHHRVADLIAARPDAGGPQRSAMLAHHLTRSDDRRAAFEATLQAARDAEGVPSYLTAARFFRQAGDIADALLAEGGADEFAPLALEAHAGVARLVVLFGLPMIDEARHAADRARTLAEQLGDLETLAGLLYFSGILALSAPGADFGAGLALAEQGLALAEREGLVRQAMRLKRGLAVNYALDGRWNEALVMSRAILQAFGDEMRGERPSDLLLSTRWVHGFVLYASDALDEALAHGRDTLGACERVRNRTVHCIVASTLGQIHLMRGEYEAAMQLSERALSLGEAIDNVNVLPAAAAGVVVAGAALGRSVDHERLLELMERGLDPGGLVQMNFRFVSDAFAEMNAARVGLARVRAASRTGGGRLRRTLIAVTCGDLEAALGHGADALAAYDEAIALAESIGARSLLVQAVAGRLRLGPVPDALLRRAVVEAERLRLGRYLPVLHDASGQGGVAGEGLVGA